MINNDDNFSEALSLSSKKEYSSLSEFTSLQEFPNTKPLILIDKEKKIIFLNNSAKTNFEINASDSISSIKSVPRIDVIIENMLAKGFLSFHFDLFFDASLNKKDSYFVEIDMIFISGKQFFVIVFNSLEERHKIEDRINSLHNALEYGNIPMLIVDGENKITYSTTSLESIIELNISQLYKKNIAQILEPIVEKKDFLRLKDSLANHTEWHTVIKVNRKGEEQWFELLLKPVLFGSSENYGYVLTLNDISRYIKATYEIQKTERRQRAIVANISEPILILREESDNMFIEGVNDSFCEEFGVQSENIVELDFSLCHLSDLAEVIYTAIDRLSSDNKEALKFRFTNQENGHEYLCKFAILTYEHFENRTFIISFFDITAQIENERRLRIAYEKELHLNKLKSTFLANMSHEIRTPLNAVVGYSDLLKMEIEELGNNQLMELMDYLMDGIKRLNRFADNIVDVALIEAGEIKPEYRLIHLIELLNEILSEFKDYEKNKKIKIITSFEESCSFIETDPNLLKKVLSEIIDNSIKYNIENGRVEVRCYTFANEWRVEVIDSGKGIANNMLDEILKPFSQEDTDGYKRRYEGLGLGLTIANKLTKALRGKLEITSEVSKGTRVLLSFPIEATEK